MHNLIALVLLAPIDAVRNVSTLGSSPGIGMLIGSALAPAALLSATALLLLGLQNKYTALSNRVRELQREKRGFPGEGHETRLISINLQTDFLLKRLRHVRRAITALYIALLFFVLTSFTITIGMLFQAEQALVTMLFFVAGIVMMFIAALNELVEMRLAFKAIIEDVHS